jgi:hypothetical protein
MGSYAIIYSNNNSKKQRQNNMVDLKYIVFIEKIEKIVRYSR